MLFLLHFHSLLFPKPLAKCLISSLPNTTAIWTQKFPFSPQTTCLHNLEEDNLVCKKLIFMWELTMAHFYWEHWLLVAAALWDLSGCIQKRGTTRCILQPHFQKDSDFFFFKQLFRAPPAQWSTAATTLQHNGPPQITTTVSLTAQNSRRSLIFLHI